MLAYLKNFIIGLAVASFVAGAIIILFNIFQYFYLNYDFNAKYALYITLFFGSIHGLALVGSATAKYLQRKSK